MSIVMGTAGDAAEMARPDRPMAALGRLARALLQPLRYRVGYHRVVRDLAGLDSHMLKDIGVRPWEVETIAHTLASRNAPPGEGVGEAFRGVVAALRGGRGRRVRYDMAGLSDHLLADIGMSEIEVSPLGYAMGRSWSAIYAQAAADDAAAPVERPEIIAEPKRARTEQVLPRAANDDRTVKAS
jgi:uncharacterized protein YjiS (DUF1127 family)